MGAVVGEAAEHVHYRVKPRCQVLDDLPRGAQCWHVGRWLIANGADRWPKGSPPRVTVTHLDGNRFRGPRRASLAGGWVKGATISISAVSWQFAQMPVIMDP